MSYRCYEPHEALRSFVESFWLQEDPYSAPAAPPTRVVPTCGAELVVCFGEPFEQLVDADEVTPMPMALVAGQRTRGIAVRATGRTGLLIARCHPWAIGALAHSAPGSLADRYAELSDVDSGEKARTLAARVAEAGSASQRVELVESYLREVLVDLEPDPLVVEVVRTINTSWGRTGVSALACDFAISRRQLHRRFMAAIGVSAKRFSRLVRFQKALGCLRSGGPWSDAVWSCGYVDQAHLIREIREFMGYTPGAILRQPTTPLMRFFNHSHMRKLNTTTYL
jgi:AraC-like DNA-binding protein